MLNLLSSLAASTARGWRGTMAGEPAQLPAKPLELFEFEGCPFCRLVRETLTELNLDVLIYPCPKGGQRFRPRLACLGGKLQFPYLMDPNTGESLYESADIIRYLHATYGPQPARPPLLGGVPAQLGSFLASAARGSKGMRTAHPGAAPAQPLELYSFESSPYSRPVRELLCELEIPYLLRNMGKAKMQDMGPPWVRRKFFPEEPVSGRNRQGMHARTGRLQVPFLIDPNTGVEMYESSEIMAYLRQTYG